MVYFTARCDGGDCVLPSATGDRGGREGGDGGRVGAGCRLQPSRSAVCHRTTQNGSPVCQHEVSLHGHSRVRNLTQVGDPGHWWVYIESGHRGCRPPVFVWREGVPWPAGKPGKPPGEAPNNYLRWSVTFASHFACNTNVSIIVILEIEYLTYCP